MLHIVLVNYDLGMMTEKSRSTSNEMNLEYMQENGNCIFYGLTYVEMI